MEFFKAYRGAWLTVFVLLLIEFGAARQTWLWSLFPATASGVVDVLETKIIQPATAPRLVVMGSSRVRDAVVPTQLARELELPEGSVLNLGLTSGTPQDALTLYQRNRSVLSRAKVLVLGVEDWHFNLGVGAGERDRRYARLHDRLHGFDPDTRRSLLAGYVWRTFDARVQLRRLVNPRSYVGRDRLRLAPDGRLNWRQKESEFGPEIIDVSDHVRRFYRTYAFRDYTLAVIEELIALAESDGLKVLLMQVPLRDAYVDAVRAEHREAWTRYQRAVSQLAERTEVLRVERAGEVGIPGRLFYDYGHLTTAGADRFTRRLATWLHERRVFDER